MHKLTKDRVTLIRAINKAGRETIKKYHVTFDSDAGKSMENIVCLIRQDACNHFLSYSQEDETKVSFASKPEHKYDSNKRIKLSFSRYIRRRLQVGPEVPDHILTSWNCNLFGLLDPAEKYITLVSGQGIIDKYSDEFGGYSCMTGPDRSEFLELYRINPEKVQLVCYENGLQGRALLWLTDSGKYVLDRIYPSDGGLQESILKEWAREKGYEIRYISDQKITLRRTENNMYPYMDTFNRMDILSSTQVVIKNSGSYDYYLDRTDGLLTDADSVCTYCTVGINEGEEHISPDGEILCESCYCNNFLSCESCDCITYCDDATIVYSWVWDTNRYFQIHICPTCYENNYDVCYNCNESYETRRMTEAVDTERLFCNNCIDELNWCDSCEEYHEKEVWINEETQETTCEAARESAGTS